MRVQFHLPKDLPGSRATAEILVEQGKQKQTVRQDIPLVPSRLAVDLFPEGGVLVAGVRNRVYYRVRAAGGEPAAPEGHVIVLSSRGDEPGKVEALDLGADDYVTKPFGMAELVARIRTALRHRIQRQGAEPLFTHGDLSVDLTRRLITVRGSEVKLSNKEWDILRLLVLHAGKVLTHRMIMQEVWGPKVDVQYLRIYVRQLRQKLEERPDQPRHILTETGVGYRLQTDVGLPEDEVVLRTKIE
jgi:two-component system KDP operon response regulator KdpE